MSVRDLTTSTRGATQPMRAWQNMTSIRFHRNSRSRGVLLAGAAALLLSLPVSATAQDAENCLSCHRFRGLSRLDAKTGELRLFFCDADYYVHRQGQHSRVACTGCHEASEVSVIPHHVQTKVDCTRTCHIAPATGTELRFSHRPAAESVTHSVHAPEMLNVLKFDPPLLRPGQSTCLYCHDQPVFDLSMRIPEGFMSHSGGTRCDTCHADEIPIEIRYFAQHVSARMKPARPVRQLAQVCAVCHSDPQILEQIGGHDTVASYLRSFHGKASLLGSKSTANCVDCHSSHEGDQHLMLPKTDPESSIFADNVSDTCRTTACHRSAPPEMTSAAVHLELDPSVYTAEFFIAAMFVLLTAAVMMVFFIYLMLELFHATFMRRDPEHERLVVLAKRVANTREGAKLLERMTVHERLQHWGLAINFSLLVLTGMPLKFADAHWASWVVTLFGGLTVTRLVHRVCGVLLIAVFLYHLGYLTVLLVKRLRMPKADGSRRSLIDALWNAPMVLRPEDIVHFAQLFGYLLFLRKERPAFGKMNFLQKFEYWAVFWGMPVMGLSGIALWGGPGVSEWVNARVLNFAFLIHSDEAYLAFAYIAVVHMFSVIFAPVVFPLSLGSLSGQIPAGEVAEGHAGHLEEIAAKLGITAETPKRPLGVARFFKSAVKRTYSAAALATCAVLCYMSLHFLLSILFSHEAAPVDITDIPKRLDATSLVASTDGGAFKPVAAELRPRGPLAHFHRIPEWFQPDPQNSCTTTGCHAPLPHGNRIEVRAFLNMHATFVDCVVCHSPPAQTMPETNWVSLPDRDVAPTPAILRLDKRLSELPPVIPNDQRAAVSAELQSLLRESLAAAGSQNIQQQQWLALLETTHPRSKLWQRTIDGMRVDIGMHVHGEYAAKVTLFAGNRPASMQTPEKRAAMDAIRKGGDSMPAAEREAALDTLHKGVMPTGAMCTPCHNSNPTLLDFEKLGYSPGRADSLRNSAIVRQILSIEEGQPFHLPLDEGGEP